MPGLEQRTSTSHGQHNQGDTTQAPLDLHQQQRRDPVVAPVFLRLSEIELLIDRVKVRLDMANAFPPTYLTQVIEAELWFSQQLQRHITALTQDAEELLHQLQRRIPNTAL